MALHATLFSEFAVHTEILLPSRRLENMAPACVRYNAEKGMKENREQRKREK
jgi:hypothetical protein